MNEPRPFHLMAKPIGPICNIRCEYCFYLSKEALFGGKGRSGFVMREDVLESFIRQYIQAQPAGTREITFAWQGGEPTLLPQEFFEKAVELEHRYARPGMTVQNAFQTNGILVSRSRADWFAANGFLIGISIDGPEDLHNRYRLDRAGRGTFRDVMAGLENLKAAGCEFNTLTVVQSDNADHPGRVYDFLKSIGSTFMQFIPIVEYAGAPGGSGAGGDRYRPDDTQPSDRSTKDADIAHATAPGGAGRRGAESRHPQAAEPSLVSSRTVRPEQWGRFMNGIFDRWVRADIGEIYIQHFDMLLGLHAGYPASVCVHAEVCGNAMAIEHDGSIYSCDHFVDSGHRLGNLMETPLINIITDPKQIAFGSDKRDGLPDCCRSCPHLKLCRGACPKDRIRSAPGGKLNWLCEGYYALYEHTAPHFRAMVQALKGRMPASEFRRFFIVDPADRPGRNDPCSCGSGRKFKTCHGGQPSV